MEIDEEFKGLIDLGPSLAGSKLRANTKELAKFTSKLLWLACPHGEIRQDRPAVNVLLDGQSFTTWILWLCTSPRDSEVPDSYIKRAQEAYGAKSHVCGRIWGKGYVAYRCRTCGMSPCSAICHECFEKGPHRNHNFLMYRSVAGGCCDCGDPGAWKPSGFCCDHKGPAAAFHLPLPVDELLSAFTTVQVLVTHVAAALHDHYQNDRTTDEHLLAELPAVVKDALTLLQDLCMAGDVYRRIVCAAVLEDIGVCNPDLRGHPDVVASTSARNPWAVARGGSEGGEERMEVASPTEERGAGRLLESLMLSGTYLSSEVSTLFLQMLFDFDFKKDFTRVFIRQYRQFMRTILVLHEHKEIPTRMVDISVQLFSNSLLTVQMIREEKLLHTLFRNVLLLVDAQAEGAGAGSRALNCEHVIWTKRNYWPIANDLVNILSHRAVVEEFLQSIELVEEWLVVIRGFQALDPHVRQMQTHVEQENRHWTAPFFIELELVMEQLALLDSGLKDILCVDHTPNDDADAGAAGGKEEEQQEHEQVEQEEEEEGVSREELLGCLRKILALGVRACQGWLSSHASQSQLSAPWRPAPPTQPISLHIPLHRFVAFFASQMCRYGTSSVEDVLGVADPRAFLRAALQHPLQIQVLLAQIRAGMWRLNGETMLRRGWFYRSSYFYDLGFDLDLFLLQCAAVLLDADELLLTLLVSFKLPKFMAFRRPVEEASAQDWEMDARMDGQAAGQVAEDWLVLVAAVLSERARLGLTDRECIQQEVLARLCVRPQSHSQLTESICRRWHEHDQFESVLLEVAHYEPPKSDRMEQGKYRLKPELVGRYDASLIHILVRSFNHGDYEAALDQARSGGSKSSGGAGSAAGKGGEEGRERASMMMGLPPAFTSITKLLQSPILHHSLHRVLWRAVRGRGQPTSVQINLALWLLHEALHHSVEKDSDADTESPGEPYIDSEPRLMQGADGVWRMGRPETGGIAKRWGCVYRSRSMLTNMEVKVAWAREGGAERGAEERSGDEEEGESLLSLLKAMQGRATFKDARPPVSTVLDVYSSRSVRSEVMMPEADGGAAGGEGDGKGGSSVAKELARERQQAMLATFANQQRLFAEAQLESEEEEEEGEEEEQLECVICSQSAPPSLSNPVGLVCLAQRSRLLSHTSDCRGRDDGQPSAQEAAPLHIQSCGHHIHVECFHSYFQTLLQTERQLQDFLQREGNRIDLKRGLFQCPMCRQVANLLVPVLPRNIVAKGGELERRRAPASTMEALQRLTQTAQADSFLAAGLAQPEDAKTAEEREGEAMPEQIEVEEGPGSEAAAGVLKEAMEGVARRLVLITDPGAGVEVGASGGLSGAGEEMGGSVETLVGAVRMTLSCMELSQRDPSGAALGVGETLRVAQTRGLNHLRHVIELVQIMMARAPQPLVERGERVLELAVRLLCTGTAKGEAPGSRGPMDVVGEEQEEGAEAAMEDGAASTRGEALLGRDVFEVLVQVLVLLPPRTAWEWRHWLVRRAYLALWVQAAAAFLGVGRRHDGAAGETEMATEQSADARQGLGGEGSLLQVVARAVDAEGLSSGGAAGGRAEGLGGFIARCSVTFLRRTALLFKLLFHEPPPPPVGMPAEQEAEALRTLLHIPHPGATGCLGVGQAELEEAGGWMRGLGQLWASAEGARAAARALPVPQEERFPLMVPLPALYHDLYMGYRDKRCRLCQTVPHRPALCLCCGELVCFASDCCRRSNVAGATDSGVVAECYAHSVECGAGTAAFILLKTSMVLVIRETHWCLWGSPYLDAYGEEDPELKRGRPLSLNRERYEQLQLLHSTHGFDHNSRVASSWHTGAQRY